jgi:hypothetical protein
MDRVVLSMAALRLISSMIELFAAILFLKFNDVALALRINSMLGLVGPFIFLGVSLLGITAIASGISLQKLMLIVLGVVMVLLGTVK